MIRRSQIIRIRPKTELARFLLNITIIVSIFYNEVLMKLVCGNFTISIMEKQHLFIYIILLESIRIAYQPITLLLRKVPGLTVVAKYSRQLLVIKYVFLLGLKFFLIFESDHRKKFYLHSFLLEGIVLSTALLFDCFQKDNIKVSGELLLIDGLHRLSLVYELTQTFCPNLILYYAITNLIIFVMAQIQTQERYGLNQSLYVKHDIYRFLFMTIIYFGFIAVAQLSSSSFKTLVIFLACLKPLLSALQTYSQDKYNRAANYLMLCVGIMIFFELIFLKVPFLFDSSAEL